MGSHNIKLEEKNEFSVLLGAGGVHIPRESRDIWGSENIGFSYDIKTFWGLCVTGLLTENDKETYFAEY